MVIVFAQEYTSDSGLSRVVVRICNHQEIIDMVFDSRDSAKSVPLSSTLQVNTGAVSAFDRSDFYKFTVSGTSDAYISLNALNADANLSLSNSSGQQIAASTRTGRTSEAILTKLTAGTYYIEVVQSSGNTTYDLSVSSNSLFANIDDNVKLLVGDFNGDSLQDFIRQEQGGLINGVSDTYFRLGKSDGSYGAATDFSNMNIFAGNVANLIVGDFNGDKRDDIIRQEFGSYVNNVNDTQIMSFQNGNFQLATNITNMSAFNGNFVNIIAGDLNQDGRTDLIRQEKGAWLDGGFDVDIYLATINYNFSVVQLGSNASVMTGDNVQLAVSGSDIMRLEFGWIANGVNDVQFTRFTNGNLTAFQASPTANFAKSSDWLNLVGGTSLSGFSLTPEMAKLYETTGTSNSWLGKAKSNQFSWNNGTRQDFEGGYLFRNGAMAKALRFNEMPFVITGYAFTDAINRIGGLHLVGDQRNSQHTWGQGIVQDFQRGTELSLVMQRQGSYTAYVVNGQILREYYTAKGPASFLGYAASDQFEFNGGYRQNFDGGFIFVNAQGVTQVFDNDGKNRSDVLTNAFMQATSRLSGGPLYKLNESHPWGAGEVQDFEFSRTNRVTIMQATGSNMAYIVRGEMLEKYYRIAGPTSFLGYPTSDEYSFNGGVRQDFQGGYMTKNINGVYEIFSQNGQNRSDLFSSDFSWAQPVYLPPPKTITLTLPIVKNTTPQVQAPVFSNSRENITPEWLRNVTVRNAIQDYIKVSNSKFGDQVSGVQKNTDGSYTQYFTHGVVTVKDGKFIATPVKIISLPNSQPPTPNANGSAVQTPGSGSAQVSVGADGRSVIFDGIVKTNGLNVRSGPGTAYGSVDSLNYGRNVTFDRWETGTSHYDQDTGAMDNRWFRIKGTNTWVASAYINGNPGSTPVTGGNVNTTLPNTNSGSLSNPGTSTDSSASGKGTLTRTGGDDDKPSGKGPLPSYDSYYGSQVYPTTLADALSIRALGKIYPSAGGYGSDYSSFYGNSPGNNLHEGIDISAPSGTKVNAIIEGEIIGKGGPYGALAVYNKNLDITVLYLHMQDFNGKSVGQVINGGDQIGLSGSVGAKGAHLHIEVHRGKTTALNGFSADRTIEAVDPSIILQSGELGPLTGGSQSNSGTSADFSKALSFTLKWEGGYVNDPDDPGGATNKGITQTTYNGYRKSQGLVEFKAVLSISDEEVSTIYRQNYWFATGSDKLSGKLAMCHFDASVNHGFDKPPQFLAIAKQGGGSETDQARRYCNEREKYYRYLADNEMGKYLNGWLNRLNSLRSELGL
jgi:murein DD-endopeptidase MepM/ murein hydrolase activator NlpD/uncharacterized protein with LGFP repeats